MTKANDNRPLSQPERIQLADRISQAGLADPRPLLQQVGADRIEDVTTGLLPRLDALLAGQRALHRSVGGVA